MYSNFKELIDKQGITAYRVSKDTGIAQSTLSDWKTGKTTPKTDKLIILAEYFEVDINCLIQAKGEGDTDD